MKTSPFESRWAAEPDPRKLWVAAQRLAQGDSVAVAAVAARMDPGVLAQMRVTDPDFRELVEGAKRILKMAAAEWRARLAGRLRLASERALEEGRVSFLNLATRATGTLDKSQYVRPPGPLEPDEEARVYMESLSKLEPEAVLEFILARQQRFDMPAEERAAIIARWRARCDAAETPGAGGPGAGGPGTCGEFSREGEPDPDELELFGRAMPDSVPLEMEPGPRAVLGRDGWRFVAPAAANDDAADGTPPQVRLPPSPDGG